MIWHGDFMDGGRHWNNRGLGFQPPSGKDVIHLPKGLAFTTLAAGDSPWPVPEYRTEEISFEGYVLDKFQRPTFNYNRDGVSITDRFIPVAPLSEGQVGKIRRVLKFFGNDPPLNLYLRWAMEALPNRMGLFLKINLSFQPRVGEYSPAVLTFVCPLILRVKNPN